MLNESRIALQAALEAYYSEIVEANAVTTPDVVAATAAAEGVGLVVHYPIESIKDKAKQLSALRAKFMINKEGEPATVLALTNDEDSLIVDWIKDGTTKIYDAFSYAFKDIDNANPVEMGLTPSVYVDQISFLRGELWKVVTGDTYKLYRCLTNTIIPPSEIELEWLYIEDGIVDRIYFLMLLREYWDRNASSILDQSIFMALVSFVLQEWYSSTGVEQEWMKWSANFINYTNNAKSATYKRTKGITRQCSVI